MKDRFGLTRLWSSSRCRTGWNLKGNQETDRVMIENFRIRVFREVAQHLNFSRAAEELLLTQPAITQQIRALEDEFGVPLFDRGGGHIALTAGGKALLPFAERMKALSDEAFAAVAEAFGQHAGELALGASQTIGQYLLPKVLDGVPAPHPYIGITCVSRWAVRSQRSIGTLKNARVHGLQLLRRCSMAYPAGPEPTGIVGIFRTFLLSQAMEMAPKRIARTNAS